VDRGDLAQLRSVAAKSDTIERVDIHFVSAP
jgi:hypothetical protein